MDPPQHGATPPFPPAGPEGRLDSWKKIAAYLKRDVSTVQRWERREAMPVHRHLHDTLGSVYAFRSELDAWRASRGLDFGAEPQGLADAAPAIEPDREAARGSPPSSAGAAISPSARRRRSLWLGVAVAALLTTGAIIWFAGGSRHPSRSPLANAQFRPLTDFDGTENAAAISRDGSFVAFLADRDGQMDVWVTRVDSGDFRNLTRGTVPELVNPSIRTLGFSPDGALVSIWTRQPDGSKSEDISIWAAPTGGGQLRPYLAETAEFDWSSNARRLVYHTTAPGDPLFVRDGDRAPARRIYVAAAGVHCHFPVWSPDDTFIYFVRGVPPNEWDIWRIRPSGGAPERITFHNARVTHPVFLDRRTLLYLATDQYGSGPWLYAADVVRRVSSRISSGIERYTSLAASADASHLVVTVSNSKASLWRLAIGEEKMTESSAIPVALPTGRAWSPRFGPGYLLYVSSKGGREGIWKLVQGKATELWSSPDTQVVGAPAIAPDGQRIAFSVEENARTRLIVMNHDGTNPKVLSNALELRGGVAWAPDGESIVSGANRDGAPYLFRFPASGEPPVLLVGEYSLNPVWSPDGRFLVYAGPDVGTTFPLRAATSDGRAYSLPSLILTRGARVRFVSGPNTLVVLRGEIDHKDFWLIDLATGTERQLTNLPRDSIVRDFDVSADGGEIVFDRVQESSDIVLIDRDG